MCGAGYMDSSTDWPFPTLWVYGDSFACEPSRWAKILSDKLGWYKISNYGWPGGSLEKTSISISDTYSMWEPKDVVVVCLTEVHRIDGFSPGNHNQDRPVRKLNTALRNHMIYSLSYLKDISSLRALVVLDGFKDDSKANRSVTMPANMIYSDKGSLMEVAQGEIKDFQAQSMGVDSRENHLSPVNHEILADKVLSAIESGQNIDLSEGFQRKIFDI
tara:strand:- start:9 stop:659 length:651 start_codon:yes stop_codon:yes gene_type:complete